MSGSSPEIGTSPRIATSSRARGSRTAAAWELHADGYSADAILEQYRQLSAEDIRAAIAFEQRRLKQKRLERAG